MSEQASLLDLFAEEIAAPAPVKDYQHFGMQDGECGMCSTHDSNTKPGIYWCHVCDRLGCWEWLSKHKD